MISLDKELLESRRFQFSEQLLIQRHTHSLTGGLITITMMQNPGPDDCIALDSWSAAPILVAFHLLERSII